MGKKHEDRIIKKKKVNEDGRTWNDIPWVS